MQYLLGAFSARNRCTLSLLTRMEMSPAGTAPPLAVLVCPPGGHTAFTGWDGDLCFTRTFPVWALLCFSWVQTHRKQSACGHCRSQQTCPDCKGSVVGSVDSILFSLRPWSFSPVTQGSPCTRRGRWPLLGARVQDQGQLQPLCPGWTAVLQSLPASHQRHSKKTRTKPTTPNKNSRTPWAFPCLFKTTRARAVAASALSSVFPPWC